MGAPVVHWEVNARDGFRAREFYSSLFGWKINAENPMNYGIVDTGSKEGAAGGIGQADANTPGPSVTFYVQVADLQAYLNKAEALGGRTVMPVTEIPGMITLAMFADPEGNVIGLVKEPERPPKKKAAPKKKKAAPKKKAAAKKKPAKKSAAKKKGKKRR